MRPTPPNNILNDKRLWLAWNRFDGTWTRSFIWAICNTYGKLGEGKGVTSSDCIREGMRGMNVLDVGDPRPGISLSERPCDKRAERSNQEEPKQALDP
jgi:hypothetical protein